MLNPDSSSFVTADLPSLPTLSHSVPQDLYLEILCSLFSLAPFSAASISFLCLRKACRHLMPPFLILPLTREDSKETKAAGAVPYPAARRLAVYAAGSHGVDPSWLDSAAALFAAFPSGPAVFGSVPVLPPLREESRPFAPCHFPLSYCPGHARYEQPLSSRRYGCVVACASAILRFLYCHMLPRTR